MKFHSFTAGGQGGALVKRVCDMNAGHPPSRHARNGNRGVLGSARRQASSGALKWKSRLYSEVHAGRPRQGPWNLAHGFSRGKKGHQTESPGGAPEEDSRHPSGAISVIAYGPTKFQGPRRGRRAFVHPSARGRFHFKALSGPRIADSPIFMSHALSQTMCVFQRPRRNRTSPTSVHAPPVQATAM